MEIILVLLFAIVVIAGLLYFTVKRLDNVLAKNRELQRQNKAQRKELNNAKTRKEIQQTTATITDSDIDDRLQQSGYFRD
ncbi:MAG: DUF2681 domain-containing protein [Gammaproteobacteria bacterium]|nr:DUF2681 domain-containing protein [Gammaproteobacteria bacterium]